MAGSPEGPWSIPGKPQHPMGESAGSASQLRTSSPGVSRGCIPATFLLGRNFKTRRRYHSGRFGRHSRMANLRLPLQPHLMIAWSATRCTDWVPGHLEAEGVCGRGRGQGWRLVVTPLHPRSHTKPWKTELWFFPQDVLGAEFRKL